MDSKNDFALFTCSIDFADKAITSSFNPFKFLRTSFIDFNAGLSNSSYKQGINIAVGLFFNPLFNSLIKSFVIPYS